MLNLHYDCTHDTSTRNVNTSSTHFHSPALTCTSVPRKKAGAHKVRVSRGLRRMATLTMSRPEHNSIQDDERSWIMNSFLFSLVLYTSTLYASVTSFLLYIEKYMQHVHFDFNVVVYKPKYTQREQPRAHPRQSFAHNSKSEINPAQHHLHPHTHYSYVSARTSTLPVRDRGTSRRSWPSLLSLGLRGVFLCRIEFGFGYAKIKMKIRASNPKRQRSPKSHLIHLSLWTHPPFH